MYNKTRGHTADTGCHSTMEFSVQSVNKTGKVVPKSKYDTNMPVIPIGIYPHMPIPLGCIASGG